MAKSYGAQIAKCLHCNKPIGNEHPYTWCIECGEPLSEDILSVLPKIQKLRAAEVVLSPAAPKLDSMPEVNRKNRISATQGQTRRGAPLASLLLILESIVYLCVGGGVPDNPIKGAVVFFVLLFLSGILAFMGRARRTIIGIIILSFLFVAFLPRRWFFGGIPVFDTLAVILCLIALIILLGSKDKFERARDMSLPLPRKPITTTSILIRAIIIAALGGIVAGIVTSILYPKLAIYDPAIENLYVYSQKMEARIYTIAAITAILTFAASFIVIKKWTRKQ